MTKIILIQYLKLLKRSLANPSYALTFFYVVERFNESNKCVWRCEKANTKNHCGGRVFTKYLVNYAPDGEKETIFTGPIEHSIEHNHEPIYSGKDKCCFSCSKKG